jgi:intracellular sulfur oxidation DsrE/DsrF family protein
LPIQLHKEGSSSDTNKNLLRGEAVTSLTMEDAEAWVERISKYPNVSIMACGLSLTKFNKTKNDLVKGIKYTENGFIKAFELQKAGYLSVEL